MRSISRLLLFACLCIYGCTKDTFITSPDAQLSFSADTLFYDTVFTGVGTITQFVRIFNNNDQKLRLTSINLGGGSNSPFTINVDGSPGSATDVEVLPNDSIYVFVSLTIDPGAANLPFVVSDSLRVAFNGTERWVQLQAWGQNANFLRGHTVTGNEVWTKDKPYVILGQLLVDKSAKLTLEKGCRVYFHSDAPFLVDGTLQINGENTDGSRVQLRGDRLDDPYRNFPGAWPGIHFRATSVNNVINNADITNAYQGIVAEQPASNNAPKLVLNGVVIQNCFDAGILAVRTSIDATNTLVANCGKNIEIALGGDYRFRHLTSAGYSNSYVAHKFPVLVISDLLEEAGVVYSADLRAEFVNCIFWGDDGLVKDEVTVTKEGNGLFDVGFSNSIWKISNVPQSVVATAMVNNQDPMFETIDSDKKIYSFHVKENSPAVKSGKSIGVIVDLEGNPRKPVPDAGAYERP